MNICLCLLYKFEEENNFIVGAQKKLDIIVHEKQVIMMLLKINAFTGYEAIREKMSVTFLT